MFLLEFIGDLIIDIYIELMMLFLPQKRISKVARFILETVVTVIAILLLFSIGLGVIQLFKDDPFEQALGRYMIFIPLGIIAVQIALGIIVRIISKKK